MGNRKELENQRNILNKKNKNKVSKTKSKINEYDKNTRKLNLKDENNRSSHAKHIKANNMK